MKKKKYRLSLIIGLLMTLNSFGQWTVIHDTTLADYHLFDLHARQDTLIAVGYKADGATSVFKSVILVSTDNGANWDEQIVNGRFLKTMDFAANGKGYIGGFGVGNTSYIMISQDGGMTWSDHLADGSTAGITHLEFVNDSLGYASGYGAGQFLNPNMYQTVDGGINWTARINTAPEFTTFDRFELIGSDMYALSSVYFSGTVTGNEMSYSADSGKTWIQLLEHTETLGGMAWVDGLTGYIITGDGGIERSTDGGVNWSEVHNTGGDGLFAIVITDSVGFAVGANGTLLRTTDLGVTWTADNSGVEKALAGVVIAENRAYVLGEDGLILRFGEDGDGGDDDDGGGGNSGEWPVGIEENRYPDGCVVFPNPTNDHLNILLDVDDRLENTSFQVYDAQGKYVLQQTFNGVKAVIDLRVLTPGIYFYQCFDASGTLQGTGRLSKT